MTYQVHLNGVAPGHDAAVVAAALAPAFKRPVAQVLAILNGPAIVLKRGLDRRTAEHYVASLTRAGCACSMQVPDAPPQAPARLAKVAWAVPNAGPPILPTRSGPPADPGLAMAASGQALCIDAILLSVVFLVLYPASGLALILCSIAISALSVLGVVRIARGLELSLPVCVFNTFAALIPLINTILLCALSVMVSRRVRQAGFKMGFLGVSAHERGRLRGAAPGLPRYNRWPSIAAVVALVFIWSCVPAALEQPVSSVAPPPPVPARIAPVDEVEASDISHIEVAQDGGIYAGADRAPDEFEASDVSHIEVARDGTIYAGADRASYRSTNGGASWERLKDTVLGHFTLSSNGQLFEIDRGYVYKSTDGGQSFTEMGYATQKGDEEEDLYASHISFAAGRLYAVSDGLIVSDDEGRSWRHVKKAMVGGRVHAASDGTLYYGFDEVTSSSDGGRTWNAIPLPKDKSMYEMATSTDGTLVIAPDEWGGDGVVPLWSTRDKGKTWARADQGLPKNSDFRVLVLAGLADGSMMAAGIDGLIYRRAAGASGWTKTSSGLPGTAECALGQKKISTGVYAIAQAPDGRLYAGTHHGVFVSRDQGNSWTPSLVLRTGS